MKCREWLQHNDLRVSRETLGLRIGQAGKAYLSKGWELSQEVCAVFETAFSHGITCLIQRGHPSESKLYETGSTLDYISFSPSPEHYWVFALDMDSCSDARSRRRPHRVKFKKVYRHILRANGIKCPAVANSTKSSR